MDFLASLLMLCLVKGGSQTTLSTVCCLCSLASSTSPMTGLRHISRTQRQQTLFRPMTCKDVMQQQIIQLGQGDSERVRLTG